MILKCTVWVPVSLLRRFRGSYTDDSMLTIPIGNASHSTELSYEFDIRDHAKPNKKGTYIANLVCLFFIAEIILKMVLLQSLSQQ